MDESNVFNKIYLSSSRFENHKKPEISATFSPIRIRKFKVGKRRTRNCENETSLSSGRTSLWSVSKTKAIESIRSIHNTFVYTKKGVKHALRQQAKRRRKNTTIAAGNFIHSCYATSVTREHNEKAGVNTHVKHPTTMNDVLTSIPGFCIKHKKRSNKKLSAAAQLQQTKEGCIDLKSSDSILAQTNLRELLNEQALSSLPPFYQHKLIQLLPPIDRISVKIQTDIVFKLSPSGLNNEFFKSACSQWRNRLAEGEFTPEIQQKRKLEADKKRNTLDPWKIKHFEPIWGENMNLNSITTIQSFEKESISPKSLTVKFNTKRTSPRVLKNRTVGAITRSVSIYREKRETDENATCETKKLKTVSHSCANYLTNRGHIAAVMEAERKHHVDKLLEVEVVESKSDRRDRHDLPLIKAVQFEPDISVYSLPQHHIFKDMHKHKSSGSETLVNGKREENSHTKFYINSEKPVTQIELLITKELCVDEYVPENCEQLKLGIEPQTSETLLNVGEEIEVEKDVTIGSSPKNTQIANEAEYTKEENALLEESENIVKMIYEEEDNQTQAAILAAWNDVGSNSETLLEEVNLTDHDFEVQDPKLEVNTQKELELQSEPCPEENHDDQSRAGIKNDESNGELIYSENPKHEDMPKMEKEEARKKFNPDLEKVRKSVSIHKLIEKDRDNWYESKEEQVEAAILAAAWDVVDSSTEKILTETDLDKRSANISKTKTMEERLGGNCLPAVKALRVNEVQESSITSKPNTHSTTYCSTTPIQSKSETISPSVVDDHVTSTVDSNLNFILNVDTSGRVIPVSSDNSLQISNISVTSPIVTNPIVSTNAFHHVPVSTNSSGRAISAKIQTKSGRSGHNSSSNKLPPGAVNLERSYQICQAAVQNSPNREQLKSQLKLPPSLRLASKKYSNPRYKSMSVGEQPYETQSENQTLTKPFFVSAPGSPFAMTVLPSFPSDTTKTQISQYVLVQRTGLGADVQRSNSAPPANVGENPAGFGSQELLHTGSQTVMRAYVTNTNIQTFQPVPQQYNMFAQINNDCSCTGKAMVICRKCGAFCHNDCIEPYKVCRNCRENSPWGA